MESKVPMERHFTATAYIIENNKVLLIPHPKLKKWLPPGGHIEAHETPPECVRREVLEETGLHIEIVPQENLWVDFWNAKTLERPYLCLLENVPAFPPKAAHQHIDLIYLARPVGGELAAGARWFSLAEATALVDDEEIFSETKKIIRHLLLKKSLTDPSSTPPDPLPSL